MLKKILASIGITILFGLFLLISYVPFNVRFSDDFEFLHGKRSSNKMFHIRKRFRNLGTIVFWDIRRDLDLKQYTLFWVFIFSYTSLVVSMVLWIWFNPRWLLASIRLTALTAFISIMPAIFSRRFTLYRFNRIQNRKEYRKKLQKQENQQLTAKTKFLLVITIAGGVLLTATALVFLIWYIPLQE